MLDIWRTSRGDAYLVMKRGYTPLLLCAFSLLTLDVHFGVLSSSRAYREYTCAVCCGGMTSHPNICIVEYGLEMLKRSYACWVKISVFARQQQVLALIPSKIICCLNLQVMLNTYTVAVGAWQVRCRDVADRTDCVLLDRPTSHSILPHITTAWRIKVRDCWLCKSESVQDHNG